MMTVSVRNLVEFVLRQGDLQFGMARAGRTLEGIKAHQSLQKLSVQRTTEQKAMAHQKVVMDYLPEVTLSYVYQEGNLSLEIKGRADGVIRSEAGVCIDEIKSTSMDLDLIDEKYSQLHWAQAQCYAFMCAMQEGLKEIEVQLTYAQLDTTAVKVIRKHFTLPTLSDFFLSVVRRYLAWAVRLQDWKEIRDASIRRLEFPFPSYRPGQRELVVAVYKTIREGQKLFAQAPTGIGKTMGTLFPALKALEEGFSETVFYLTAKTITRTVAEKALGDLQSRGLALKVLTLTAKDKICFLPEATCDPEHCLYARGYFDRLRPAMDEVFSEKVWIRPVIEAYARKHALCPFEFSLELANWADVVICDYNYVFDPRVYLRRFFLEGGEYTFLVDEAHNLVDRAREMFSAELPKEPWLKLKRAAKEYSGLSKSISKVNTAFTKEQKRMKALEQQGEEEQAQQAQLGVLSAQTWGGGVRDHVEKTPPGILLQALRTFNKEAERFLRMNEEPVPWRDEFLELYFQALSFIRTSEGYDEHYITYWEYTQTDLRVKLFCLDPSQQLKGALGRAKATILFSATLSPMEYFMEILGGEEDSYKLRLGSPFPSENLNLMIQNRISTKYNQRSTTYHQVAKEIAAAVAGKTGNYLVFFPSYEYLQAVFREFDGYNKSDTQAMKVIRQVPGMAETEREHFLAQFAAEPKETLVGFALMGGIFGEGIDLIGERLSGAIIVGVGLPQIGLERELIRSYYQERSQLGFEFAYMYPGFNKVLQAVGRVIRTETDRGIVLLIDERFARAAYRRIFPKEWGTVRYLSNTEEVQRVVEDFWKL